MWGIFGLKYSYQYAFWVWVTHWKKIHYRTKEICQPDWWCSTEMTAILALVWWGWATLCKHTLYRGARTQAYTHIVTIPQRVYFVRPQSLFFSVSYFHQNLLFCFENSFFKYNIFWLCLPQLLSIPLHLTSIQIHTFSVSH